MPALPAFPKSYSTEIVRSDGDRSVLYVDEGKRRLDLYLKIGQPSVVISRPDKRVIWSLSPNTMTYSQAKMPDGMERVFDPDTLYDWSEDGIEKIEGRRCRRFIGRYREASGPIGDAHEVCFFDAQTKMRRRVISFDIKGKLVLTIDYLNTKIGPPPRQVFEMPEGYKRAYYRRKRVVG